MFNHYIIFLIAITLFTGFTLAQDAIILSEAHGQETMATMIAKRRGGAYEAELADLFLAHADRLIATPVLLTAAGHWPYRWLSKFEWRHGGARRTRRHAAIKRFTDATICDGLDQ